MFVVANRILVSALGPFGFKWVLDLFGTWFGLGLGGSGTKGLGPGLTILGAVPWSRGKREGSDMDRGQNEESVNIFSLQG